MNLTNAIMDFVLMGLLVAALWFGVRLDKKLKALRGAHEGFARAVADLDQAAIRAHNSLKELRSEADDSQELLHGRILAARDLMQKLKTGVTRAERAVREIDGNMSNLSQLQNRAEQTAKRLEAAPRPEPVRAEPRQIEMPRYAAEPVREPAREAARETAREPIRPQPRIEDDADYNPAWAAPKKAPPVARGAAQDSRNPFERDVIRYNGAQRADDRMPERRSILPEARDVDESEILDKVQMSELVVANLNEMIRSLTMPSRQPTPSVLSLEDDLFGDDAAPAPRSKK